MKSCLLDNPNLTIEKCVSLHRSCVYEVSKNPHLTFGTLMKYSNWRWNEIEISRNPGITMQDIMNHPEVKWDWEFVGENPNMSIDMIKHNPDRNWRWSGISANPGITMRDIIKHPEYPLEWDYVMANQFAKERSAYVERLYSALLLTYMMEDAADYTRLSDVQLVLYADLHLYHILAYL